MMLSLVKRVVRRIYRPHRNYYHKLFAGRRVLEIGGPSSIFQADGDFPIYGTALSVDNANFAAQTIWEGQIQAGKSFHYRKGSPAGEQFITEATQLTMIPDETYDAVISSHTLEHLANPLKALHEWKRVSKPQSLLLVIVPHKDMIFDHRRDDTTFEHLLDDLHQDTQEDDLTHLNEILAKHDLKRDPPAGSPAEFEARSRLNVQNRCLHHHVFSKDLMAQIAAFLELDIVRSEIVDNFHLVSTWRKR